ncbi:MAG: O-antigen ligase family protein [Pyrinomonadaceae bacterium]|nr:O-antigen ligase family protein [Pyrinomonadaceae bacterium]
MYPQAAHLGRVRYPSLSQTQTSALATLAFFAAHIPLALLMRQYPRIGFFHALATCAWGLRWTTFKSRPELVAYTGAYIMGAEVLWRMTRTPIFWEFGKYAVVTLFVVSIVARRRLKPPPLPLLYFALLLPSVLLTAGSMSFETARQQLSFNLSGPLALMASAWFFSQIELSKEKVLRLFSALIGPIVGIAALAILSTLTHQGLQFTGASNKVTSGGFGPNQVSTILGLGALAAYFYMLERGVSHSFRLLTLFILVVFTAQSAMTFSRGGLYIAAGSALAGSLFLARSNRTRIKLVLGVAIISTIGYYLVLPRLDAFSQGKLSARFQNSKTTGRDHLAAVEFEAWQKNPILGLGPGGAEPLRHKLLHSSGDELMASHTEYTRLVAEHGILGLNALLLLLLAGVSSLRRANTLENKARITSFLVWSSLFMAFYGMRLVAPSFIFGLAFATFALENRVGYRFGGSTALGQQRLNTTETYRAS